MLGQPYFPSWYSTPFRGKHKKWCPLLPQKETLTNVSLSSCGCLKMLVLLSCLATWQDEHDCLQKRTTDANWKVKLQLREQTPKPYWGRSSDLYSTGQTALNRSAALRSARWTPVRHTHMYLSPRNMSVPVRNLGLIEKFDACHLIHFSPDCT